MAPDTTAEAHLRGTVIIELVGVEQAQRCWEAARRAETDHERDAWGRLARRYMRKRTTRTLARESRASARELGQLAGNG